MPSFRTLFVAAFAVCVVAGQLGAQRGRVSVERPQIDTTIAFDAAGTIELELATGEIRVTAWTRNEVQIVASSTRGMIAGILSPSRIELDVSASRGGSAGATRYVLTVPVGVTVAARTGTGSITISGTRGNLDLETRSGRIDASDASGRIDVEATSGRIDLQRVSGSTSVAAIGGTVTMSEVEGRLDIETTSGRVLINRANLQQFTFESVSGTLDFSGTLAGAGPHAIETHSGDVTLRLPASFAATLDLETFRGELRPVDFSVVTLPGEARGRDSDRIRFAINGGGVPLSISTFTGDIFLRKIGATPQDQ